MPKRRKTSIASLPLAELRQLVAQREHVLQQLQNREQSLLGELAGVRSQIVAIVGRHSAGRGPAGVVKDAGPKRRGRHGRGVGGQTVAQALVEILRRHAKPMRVGEMADAFKKTGHPTKSKNLEKLIAITIKSPKQFKRVARGLYTAK
jgi:hypothetical protein